MDGLNDVLSLEEQARRRLSVAKEEGEEYIGISAHAFKTLASYLVPELMACWRRACERIVGK